MPFALAVGDVMPDSSRETLLKQRRERFSSNAQNLGEEAYNAEYYLFLSKRSGSNKTQLAYSVETAPIEIIDLLIQDLLKLIIDIDGNCNSVVTTLLVDKIPSQRELKNRYKENRLALDLSKDAMDGILSMGMTEVKASKGVSYRKELPEENKNSRVVLLKELVAQELLLKLKANDLHIPTINFEHGMRITSGPIPISAVTLRARDAFLKAKNEGDNLIRIAKISADALIEKAKNEAAVLIKGPQNDCHKLKMGIDPFTDSN
jgi:hypothetical protein